MRSSICQTSLSLVTSSSLVTATLPPSSLRRRKRVSRSGPRPSGAPPRYWLAPSYSASALLSAIRSFSAADHRRRQTPFVMIPVPDKSTCLGPCPSPRDYAHVPSRYGGQFNNEAHREVITRRSKLRKFSHSHRPLAMPVSTRIGQGLALCASPYSLPQ